jgi:hypothetical protein
MNKIFIIIMFPLVMLLSSCSTYKAVLYPCDFNKYKCFRTEAARNDTDLYKGNVRFSADKGAYSSGLTFNASNRDDTLILTVDTTNGVIFPPHRGMHWTFSFAWDFPPKTATIIATDSGTGDKLFEIYYSRYMISMDSGEFWGYIQGAVEYCIKELKNNPPKDAPREINIPSSSLSEPRDRLYGRNR